MIKRIYIIALNTFRESLRSKILYSVIFFAILVCAAASAFGRVTIGEQGIVVENFGLFCTSLFSVAFVVISGSLLFTKELSKRTIFTILARPIHRFEIIAGKWLGLLLTASCLVLLMASALAIYVSLIFELDPLTIFHAAFFVIAELMIICAIVMLFSAIVVTPLFIGVFSLAIFLAGRSSSYIQTFIVSNEGNTLTSSVLKVLHSLLPNLENLAVSDQLVHGAVLDGGFYVYGFGYALGFSVLTLIAASIAFHFREFNG